MCSLRNQPCEEDMAEWLNRGCILAKLSCLIGDQILPFSCLTFLPRIGSTGTRGGVVAVQSGIALKCQKAAQGRKGTCLDCCITHSVPYEWRSCSLPFHQ